MNRRTFGRALASLVSAGTLPLGSAAAAPLTRAESDALNRGELVTRPVDADLDEGTYLGGVSYSIADVPAPFVLALLTDVSIYKRILPVTLEANPAGKKGADQLVYLKHGGKLGTAGYTMRIRPADAEGVIRFWMDPAFDHEIEDVWGYVRVEALGPSRSLLTYAVLCDLGTVLRLLFGDRIREIALRTPRNARHVVEERYSASKALPGR